MKGVEAGGRDGRKNRTTDDQTLSRATSWGPSWARRRACRRARRRESADWPGLNLGGILLLLEGQMHGIASLTMKPACAPRQVATSVWHGVGGSLYSKAGWSGDWTRAWRKSSWRY